MLQCSSGVLEVRSAASVASAASAVVLGSLAGSTESSVVRPASVSSAPGGLNSRVQSFTKKHAFQGGFYSKSLRENL